MQTQRIASYLLVIGCLLLLTAQPARPQNTTVVPGRSVGKVRLGMSRAQVVRLMGKPGETARQRGGIRKDIYSGPKPPEGSEQPQRFLNVLYRRDRVVQIEFNSPHFVTTGGISVRSSLNQFRARHRNVRATAHAYIEEGGGFIGYYYDDVRGGIAFSFGTQDYFYGSDVKPEALRIHRPGYPVLPDPGGKPEPPRDELPSGALPPQR